MSEQRFYAYATVFNIAIYNMRNLWEASTEFKGQKVQKPNYLAGFLTPKTRGHWSEEPIFADVVRAANELCQKYGIQPAHLEWPIRDGDIPEIGKAPVEYMKGKWVFTGSSSSPINTEMVQAGVPQKLTNRTVVKPGDLTVVSIALAVSKQNNRKAKIYCNSVLFVSPGEEIAVGNSVSGTQLMEMAKAQGLNVAGFQTSPGGFGGGGFGPPAAPMQGGFGGGGFQPAPQPQPGGFGQPQGGGFNTPAPAQPPQQGGFGQPAPMQGGGFGAPAQGQGGFVAPNAAPNGAGFGSPQQGGGFQPNGGGFGAAPQGGGFQPPQNGFVAPQGFPQR